MAVQSLKFWWDNNFSNMIFHVCAILADKTQMNLFDHLHCCCQLYLAQYSCFGIYSGCAVSNLDMRSPCLTRSLKPWNSVKWQGYVDNKYVQTLAQQVWLPATCFCFMCNIIIHESPQRAFKGPGLSTVGSHPLAIVLHWNSPLLQHFGWRPAGRLNWTVHKNLN